MNSIAVLDGAATRVQEGTLRPESVLDLDAATLQSKLNREPFLIGHKLADHPLFALPRLIELSRRLPEDCVAYNSGDVPLGQGLYKGPRNGLSIEETIQRIEDCRSWMVLKFVEKDPEYADLLNACLDEVKALSEPFAPGMMKREGFIFISSPGSITPLHVDPEYNFLLQLRGKKTVNVVDPADRTVLSERNLEDYYTGPSGEFVMDFEDRFHERAAVFELTPGLGLHVPVTAPHWVENGGEVSISFSITFETPFCDRRKALYTLNARLRELGVKNPIPVGQSRLVDDAKYCAFRAMRGAKRAVRSAKKMFGG